MTATSHDTAGHVATWPGFLYGAGRSPLLRVFYGHMSNADVLRLAVLAGDGVGPEITAATVEILQAAASRAGLPLDLAELPIGASTSWL